MLCLVCGETLTGIKVNGVAAAVCDGGCGGIWFNRFNDSTRVAAEHLSDAQPDICLGADSARELYCPVCYDVVLLPHSWSLTEQVNVNTCPQCGGFWLYWGELEKLRSLCEAEWQRQAVNIEEFRTQFRAELEMLGAEKEAMLAAVLDVTNRYHYICPSYFGCNSEEWGVF